MKLEDIPKKQPFEMPNEAHFDSISNKIYAQLEKEEVKSISINFGNNEENKTSKFWLKPQFIGIAATLILLLIALTGVYNYNSSANSVEKLVIITNKTEQLDFSKIPTEQINTFLLDDNISENELLSFMPQNSSLEANGIFEEVDLNSIDAESLDLLLEEEYL